MKSLRVGKTLAAAASVVVIAAVAAAIIQNPPSYQRLRMLDRKRVQDLSQIYFRINAQWDNKKALPPKLADLATNYKDPETGIPYIYEKTGDKSYRLCAVFATSNNDEKNQRPNITYDDFLSTWQHGIGQTCFDRSVSTR